MEHVLIQTECTIRSIEKTSGQVSIITLVPDQQPDYRAGQYLELQIPGQEHAFFTIASGPGHESLDIHVVVPDESSNSHAIVQYLRQSNRVTAKIGLGSCYLDNLKPETGPLLLITAGTGFSQAKAICEELFSQGPLQREVHLYWGVKKVQDLYMHDLPQQWHEEYPLFHYCAVVSDQIDWQGKQGLLYQAIQADFPDLSKCQAICCGSPSMVYATREELMKHHFRKDQMLSDVFDFAPEP
ncbi:2-polyprenylphenol hydroxylase and related flavodoxin oxidoreductase [Gynuella sunshinyii YC6258]|uniref:2-polyprenylphenol hydroxylase and related flavodoxin oxidoreductase n=1 Tax=Gynuella sunshinyii YC6258 TaxID=1445510 RepID=A0A0C5VGX8_9GAMM|nr:2-polyprenylphenol hydroxylase and related flavodoxin oxidoreductase [Gynuella sunshinyii YC6258]